MEAAAGEGIAAVGASDADVLRALVAAHRPRGRRETVARLRFLDELDRLPQPSDATRPVHVTASGVVVGRRGTVLHLHRRLGRWLQPGGHLQRGEAPPDAALRESVEETGLGLRHASAGPLLLHLDVHEGARSHTHLDLRYLLYGGDEDPRPAVGESPLARWWRWDEAMALADEALLGALVRARQLMQGQGL